MLSEPEFGGINRMQIKFNKFFNSPKFRFRQYQYAVLSSRPPGEDFGWRISGFLEYILLI
ncbi:hypothetical protein HYN43_024185 [Mucilaginibacter celer]|uniref:Uncharacterized protein n=1 Tax=Mucilaginibacter celer TaxID=2305508 RepID=A0A494VXJ1_9SPHI|nr:hypothetical protein HYN43_024185 [Mucilaginibacter celer]